MITLLVADDHPLIRQGVKQIIQDTDDISVTDEASNGQEALEKIRKGGFDVLLLDLSMPGIGGMDILKQIKKVKPSQVVLVLSRYPEEQYAIPAIKAGAAGYIAKTGLAEELLVAIRRVASGRKYVSLSLAEKLLDYKDGFEKPLHSSLSDRELEVICLIASGKSNSDIASDLYLSPSTISTYRSRIMKKMKMSSDADLVRYALEHRLI